MFEYWLLSRTNEYAFNTEYMVVSCLIGQNPLYGYGSWDVASNVPFASRSAAWQFHNVIASIEIMV
jgi:hypothetical protein